MPFAFTILLIFFVGLAVSTDVVPPEQYPCIGQLRLVSDVVELKFFPLATTKADGKLEAGADASQGDSWFHFDKSELKHGSKNNSCYIHSASKKLVCDGRGGKATTLFSIVHDSEGGYLFHDGRKDWLLCYNTPSWSFDDALTFSFYDIYSDDRSKDPIPECYTVQIKTSPLLCKDFQIDSQLSPSTPNAMQQRSPPIHNLEARKTIPLPSTKPAAPTKTETSKPSAASNISPKACTFEIESVGDYKGVVHSSLDGSTRIDGLFRTGERRYTIADGKLTDSLHHQDCFIEPATLEFCCDSEVRAKLSSRPTLFTISERDYLLHDGRADWKACINMVLLGAYDLYSERLTTKRLCHIVQLKIGNPHCPPHQSPLLSIPSASTLSFRAGAPSRAEARLVATALATPPDSCHLKLYTVGSKDSELIWAPLSHNFTLSGKHLKQFGELYCFVEARDWRLYCGKKDDERFLDNQAKTDFTTTFEGKLLHNGKENWVACKIPSGGWEGPFSDEKKEDPGCQIIQLKAIGIDCDISGGPRIFSEPSTTRLTPTKALAARSASTSEASSSSTLCLFSFQPIDDLSSSVDLSEDDNRRLEELFQRQYLLWDNQVTSVYNRQQCFIHKSTSEFLCINEGSNQQGQYEVSLDKLTNKYLLNQERYNWVLCSDGPSLWSDKKPTSETCHKVPIRAANLICESWEESEYNRHWALDRDNPFDIGLGPRTHPARAEAVTLSSSTNQPTSSSQELSCPAGLIDTPFEFPHLIVSVSSDAPSHAFGNSYIATISMQNSTVFNFDIPAAEPYINSTCAILFLFPETKHLAPSSGKYNVSGLEQQETSKGGLTFSKLEGPADDNTTWNNMPNAHALGNSQGMAVAIQPGNSYVIGTGPCESGKTMTFMMASQGGVTLSYFQNSAPSAVGLYIVPCSWRDTK